MRWYYLVPVVLFVGLVAVFALNLFHTMKTPVAVEISTLVDKPAPRVSLPALDAKTDAFASSDLAAGHVTVLNIWASWCVPCRAEVPALTQLAAMKDIKLYGLVYKDTPANARTFLAENGNPYARIDLDHDGEAGIDWGITAVPETFVIDGKGVVRLHYAGPLVGSALTDYVLPAIERAKQQG